MIVAEKVEETTNNKDVVPNGKFMVGSRIRVNNIDTKRK